MLSESVYVTKFSESELASLRIEITSLISSPAAFNFAESMPMEVIRLPKKPFFIVIKPAVTSFGMFVVSEIEFLSRRIGGSFDVGKVVVGSNLVKVEADVSVNSADSYGKGSVGESTLMEMGFVAFRKQAVGLNCKSSARLAVAESGTTLSHSPLTVSFPGVCEGITRVTST